MLYRRSLLVVLKQDPFESSNPRSHEFFQFGWEKQVLFPALDGFWGVFFVLTWAVLYLALDGSWHTHLLISALLHTRGKPPAGLWSPCGALSSGCLTWGPSCPVCPISSVCWSQFAPLYLAAVGLWPSGLGPALLPVSQRSLSLLLTASVLGTIVSYILSSFWLFQEGSKSSTCYSSLARSRLSD